MRSSTSRRELKFSFWPTSTSSVIRFLGLLIPAVTSEKLILSVFAFAVGLVNGSRGVIVDWVRKGEEPLEHESLAGVRNAAEQSRNRGRGGFGSEEWRETAASDFMDKQLEAYLPVVFFAVGITREFRPCFAARAPGLAEDKS